MKTCSYETNAKSCTCTADCKLHGLCCECIAKHRGRDQVPGCLFTEEGERLYDRSFEAFIKDRG